jgi:hypothetical protein
MFTLKTTRRATTKPRGRRLTALTCAIVLAMALAGPAAAIQSSRDLPDGNAISINAGLSGVASSGWLTAKLRTTTGYQVLVHE